MKNFANFSTRKFGDLAVNELMRWGENSSKYKPGMAGANSLVTMLGGLEAAEKASGGRSKYRLRTLRDNTLPGRPVIGGAMVYKDPVTGQTILDGLASNPDYNTGNVLKVARERFGSGLRVMNAFSDRPYEKAGWIRKEKGFEAP